jgi:hypothetical protein
MDTDATNVRMVKFSIVKLWPEKLPVKVGSIKL